MTVMPWPRSDAERQSDEFWERNWRGAGLVEVIDAQGRVWHVHPERLRPDERPCGLRPDDPCSVVSPV